MFRFQHRHIQYDYLHLSQEPKLAQRLVEQLHFATLDQALRLL